MRYESRDEEYVLDNHSLYRWDLHYSRYQEPSITWMDWRGGDLQLTIHYILRGSSSAEGSKLEGEVMGEEVASIPSP